eukprot:7379210-Prymnesium_polylepis.1
MSSIDLKSLRVEQLQRLAANMWLLSPPCQPYSRQGQQLGGADKRAGALTHIIDILEGCPSSVLPLYVLLENVVGFESSGMRQELHAALVRRGYSVRELWASPVAFGVPNQRTRYFLLARRTSEGEGSSAAVAAKGGTDAAAAVAAEPAATEPAAIAGTTSASDAFVSIESPAAESAAAPVQPSAAEPSAAEPSAA